MNRHRVHRADSSRPLINTPLQRGDTECGMHRNRFSGFAVAQETAEAVRSANDHRDTPLKRGVNENLLAKGPESRDGGPQW
jgi:hypothetical protein